MAKYHGIIGFVANIETQPGFYNNIATEKKYSGDVKRLTRRLESSSDICKTPNADIQISILADSFAYKNWHMIRYVEWNDAFWEVRSIDIMRPRITITLGGLYNGHSNIQKTSIADFISNKDKLS